MHLHGARAGTAARFLLLPLATLLVAGCAVGPNTGPAVVREGGSPGIPTTSAKKAGFPLLPGVRADLPWQACPPTMVAQYGVRPGAQVRVECATMVNRADPNVVGGEAVHEVADGQHGDVQAVTAGVTLGSRAKAQRQEEVHVLGNARKRIACNRFERAGLKR